jgi:hypothetical protein
MNLALEKKLLKEKIDAINDEGIIEALKKLIGLASQPPFKKLTGEDLINRALESENAIAENRVSSLEDLEKEMKKW